jgi:hypothetical protein
MFSPLGAFNVQVSYSTPTKRVTKRLTIMAVSSAEALQQALAQVKRLRNTWGHEAEITVA